MDWAKAKTILIAAFLIIDMFFAYMIIGAGSGGIGYVDTEKVRIITDYLAEKNISIEGKVPAKKADLPSITVKYRLFGKEDITKNFFEENERAEESISGSTVIFKGKNIEISIKDNREFNYTDSSIKPSDDIDSRACKKHITEFLTKLGIKNDIIMKKAEETDGYKRFVYAQSFKGIPVYNSIIEIRANDSGIKSARIVWFETIRQSGKKTELISPVVALLYLTEYNKKVTAPIKEVLEIQQGYYFGTGAKEQVDASKVEGGTAFPVWRITTDKDIIYINAYNEKTEGIEKAVK